MRESNGDVASGETPLEDGLPIKRPRVSYYHDQVGEIARGAEGVVSRIRYLDRVAISKVRFTKSYRHPDLDRRLTSRRLAQEARILLRLRKEGLKVPAVYCVDSQRRVIIMEDLEGPTLREYLHQEPQLESAVYSMRLAGEAIAVMHYADVAHGDLTTSNILVLKPVESDSSITPELSVALIDFGLSSSNVTDEDLAVDLYVLERAVISAHSSIAKVLNEAFIDAYSAKIGRPSVLSKLEEVRARGRKRDMVG